jgi:hypothetical protein
MNALNLYSGTELPPDVAKKLREIERRFQKREFGEELARVNLDMTEAERWDYLSWMRATARQHGIDPRAQSVHAWMDRLEEEMEREELEREKRTI